MATAFDTYAPFSTTVSWQGNQIPLAVAKVCAWTWACSTPPSGPNIHANKNGYLEIAQVFANVDRQAQLTERLSDTAARAGSTSISWSRRTASR